MIKNHENKTLKINEEFKNLIPSLSDDEYQRLEQSILNEGCREPITVWEETIIDGHNRYEICKKHSKRFEITEKQFTNRDEVKKWMIENQLGRRNLTPENRTYLIGKLYNEQKKDSSENLKQNQDNQPKSQNDISGKDTAQDVAKKFKTSKSSVKRAGKYSESLDKVAQNIGLDFIQKIMNKEVIAGEKDIIILSKLEPAQQKEVIQKLDESKNKKLKTFLPKESTEKRSPEPVAKSELQNSDLDLNTDGEELKRENSELIEKIKQLQQEKQGLLDQITSLKNEIAQLKSNQTNVDRDGYVSIEEHQRYADECLKLQTERMQKIQKLEKRIKELESQLTEKEVHDANS